MDAAAYEKGEDLLQCFKCDLGFWDACYTTKTNCSHGERCYTGRGKAGAVEGTQSFINKTIRCDLKPFFVSSGHSGCEDFGLCKSRRMQHGDHSRALPK